MNSIRDIALQIVDIFDEFLSENNINISCLNTDEELERTDEDGSSSLYGTEYWDLVDEVETFINLNAQDINKSVKKPVCFTNSRNKS